MHKEDNSPQNEQDPAFTPPALGSVWQELLGKGFSQDAAAVPTEPEPVIPTLEVDPWSTLLQANGVEVFDLQSTHLRISDQEVEQMLRFMQEPPDLDR